MVSIGLMLVFAAILLRPTLGLVRAVGGFLLRTALIGLVVLAVTTGGNGVSMERSFDRSIERLRGAAEHIEPLMLSQVPSEVYRWVTAELHLPTVDFATVENCDGRLKSSPRQTTSDKSQHC